MILSARLFICLSDVKILLTFAFKFVIGGGSYYSHDT